MHPEQQIFCLQVKAGNAPKYRHFHGVKVLDCGSRDINGNNRYLFHDSEYIGVDICDGPNVDVVMPIHELTYPDDSFDTVICTEVLEHDPHWPESIVNMIRMLKPGGLLIITCAGPERGPHSQDIELEHPADGEYYGNLDFYDMQRVWIEVLGGKGMCHTELGRDAKDIYFWGIKSEEGSNG